MPKIKTLILPEMESKFKGNLFLPDNFHGSENIEWTPMKPPNSVAAKSKHSNQALGHDPESALLITLRSILMQFSHLHMDLPIGHSPSVFSTIMMKVYAVIFSLALII
jgi:hypothetical protein